VKATVYFRTGESWSSGNPAELRGEVNGYAQDLTSIPYEEVWPVIAGGVLEEV
jgi:hypothetical protein